MLLDFPTTAGAYDRLNDQCEAFISQFNSTGTGLMYSSFLGGASSWEVGLGVALGAPYQPPGSAKVVQPVYLTGKTWSPDFPTTPRAFDRTYNGGEGDVFVAQLLIRR
jgi:hypothetical protein